MRYFNQFMFGGVCYAVIEIVFRGFTHFSMLIAGGMCFVILLRLSLVNIPFLLKCVAGGASICAVEFVVGCVVNLWLRLNVWDYTRYGYDIMGQVCLRYFIIWSALSGLVMWGYPALLRFGAVTRRL